MGRLPGRPTDVCWLYVDRDAVKKSWTCKYCLSTFQGSITRVKAHLGGIPQQQISICHGIVPDNVKRACNPQPGDLAHVEPMGQAQPSMQPHRESGNGTSQSARGSAHIEPMGQAQPFLQPHRESDNGTTHSVACGTAHVEPMGQAQPAMLPHRESCNGTSQSARGSEHVEPTTQTQPSMQPERDNGTFQSVALVAAEGLQENRVSSSSSASAPSLIRHLIDQPLYSGSNIDTTVVGTLQANEESSSRNASTENILQWMNDHLLSDYASGGADVGVTSRIGRPELPNPGDPGLSQSLCNFATSSHPQPAEAEGSLGLQAAAQASTVVLQDVVSQVPPAEGSLGLQAAGEASIIPPGVIDSLQTSMQGHSLLEAFLAAHPTMCLSVDELTPRIVGYAYTCLADFLIFLDSHCPSDMFEARVHDKFTHLLREMRLFNFNTNWLTSVEKRVTSPFPNKEVVSQSLKDCLREENVARSNLRSLKDKIKAEKIASKRRLDGYEAEYEHSKANMTFIRERKRNALRAIEELQEPFGIRF